MVNRVLVYIYIFFLLTDEKVLTDQHDSGLLYTV